jgi:hypothetical protein
MQPVRATLEELHDLARRRCVRVLISKAMIIAARRFVAAKASSSIPANPISSIARVGGLQSARGQN